MEMIFDACQGLFGMAPWGLMLVCTLVFVAGYVDAVAGGGGLISLPAYLIAGLPTHAAIATNKLSSTMGTALTTWHFARKGYIQWRLAAGCIVAAMVGSVCGSNVVMVASDMFLRVFLLALLPLTAVYVVRSKSFGKQDKEPLPARKTNLLCLLIALVIGFYDGFYGPGTGTFLLLLLTGVAHLKLVSAAGITKAINLTTNVSALAVFLLHGQVLLLLGLVAGVFGVAGNYLGSHSFSKNGGAIARPIIIVVLAVFFVKVVWDLVA